MTDWEAIQKRTSRRSYKGAMTSAQVLPLEEQAAKLNLACDLSIHIVKEGADAFGGITKSYGMFSGVHSLVVLTGPKNDANLYEKAGHCGERLVLEATKMGLGTCWVGGTFDRKKLMAGLSKEQALVAVITVGPVKEEKGFMEKTVRRMTGDHNRPIDTFYIVDAQPPEWFLDGVKAAARAPSAINKQPVRFTLKNGVVTAAVSARQPHELIDLGIAKLHFEIGAGGTFALGNGAAFTKKEGMPD